MPLTLKNAEVAYQLKRDALLAMTLPASARRLSLTVGPLTAGLQAEVQQIESRLELAAAGLDEAGRAAFVASLEEVLDLLGALLWANAHFERQVLQADAWPALLERGRALQRSGFRWLDALVLLGSVRADEAQRLREGRNLDDLIGDLQVMSTLLEEHGERLAALQRVMDHADPAPGPEVAAEMKEVAAQLLRAERGATLPDGQTDWRDMTVRAGLLLRARWDRVRFVAAGGYAWAERLDLAEAGHPSLHALSVA